MAPRLAGRRYRGDEIARAIDLAQELELSKLELVAGKSRVRRDVQRSLSSWSKRLVV
jgi:hypothetical protein